MASNGSEYLAVWEDYANASPLKPLIMVRRMSTSGGVTTVGTAFSVSASTGAQVEPVAAWDGSTWVIAWTLRSPRDRVQYARYTAGTTGAPPTVSVVEQGMGGSNASNRFEYSPSVACRTGTVTGERCAIAFHEILTSGAGTTQVYFQPVTDSGAPSSASSVSFLDWTYAASIGTDGTTFALTWEGQPNGGGDAFIGAATFTRVGSSWNRTSTTRYLATAGPGERYSPVTAYSGSTYLVSYVTYSTATSQESVSVQTLSSTHTLGSEQSIASPGGNVHLACASGSCLAAYYLNGDLLTKIVDAGTAVVTGGTTLTNAISSQENSPSGLVVRLLRRLGRRPRRLPTRVRHRGVGSRHPGHCARHFTLSRISALAVRVRES